MAGGQERWNETGMRIMRAARNELYLSMRYLYPALDRLPARVHKQIRKLGTDGEALWFEPMQMGRLYQENPVLVNRALLHSVLHCLFSHHAIRAKRQDPAVFDTAADIAVEAIIDSIELPSVQVMVPDAKTDMIKRIKEEVHLLSAESIERYLFSHPEEAAIAEVLFTVDDHSFWQTKDGEKDRPKTRQEEEAQKQLWDDARRKVQTDLETYSRSAGTAKTLLYRELVYENRERFSYRQYLHKFLTPMEEPKLDLESFDYGFYQYGFTLYGNMPLIEEPEYRESQKLLDFGVVLDTSGSITKSQMERFLQETVSALTEKNGDSAFGRQSRCHLIQCDNEIRDYKVVTSEEELRAYLADFQIIGRGGTDFRPPFRFIEERRKEGSIGKLSGLFYFTDGYGIYPSSKPDYDVSFIFLEEDYPDGKPPWAVKEFPVYAAHLALPRD